MANIDIIRAHYEASARGDLPGMLAPLAPDVTWIEAAGSPYAGTYVGPDAVTTHVFAAIGEDWADFAAQIDELVDGGDTIVGLGHYTGTNRATGRPLHARVAHVWRLVDEVVVSFEQIVDSAVMAEAMTPA